jgi:hypothetical protein
MYTSHCFPTAGHNVYYVSFVIQIMHSVLFNIGCSLFQFMVFNAHAIRLGVNGIVPILCRGHRRSNEISDLNNSKTIRFKIFKFRTKIDQNALHLRRPLLTPGDHPNPQNWGSKTTPLNCSQTVTDRIFKFHTIIDHRILHLLSPL